MDWLTKIFSYIKVKVTGEPDVSSNHSVKSSKKPIFPEKAKTNNLNDIQMVRELSDSQIQINQTREKYITVKKNPDYKVQNGDNPAKIAKKFGVEERALLALNGLTKESALKIQVGKTLKIPDTRIIKNVKNLNDVAKSMGVSLDFVKRLKRVEDKNLPDNKFHNTPYLDEAGVKTIGIGHALKSGEPQKLDDAQVCALCAKDLLKMEENLCVLLGGRRNYDKLPTAMKEALLDMVFNKGTAIIENTPGLLYCLKSGKYEAAINKFTNNKSAKTGKEMSGLSKRRLFDISLAIKMYNGKVPQSNISTAQQVYNRGIELLRQECKAKGYNFKNVLAGYNKDVQGYFGNSLKLKYITG
ncbi:MAG: glycoside hydrolase family protein [Candidatus Gastranaerophilaceae bacterium]